jgi:hypothetical protein
MANAQNFPYEYIFKYIVIGDMGVGKVRVRSRLVEPCSQSACILEVIVSIGSM